METGFTDSEAFLAELARLHFTANDQIVPTGERECPICKKVMATEQVHRVTIDICRNHGIWLDRGELETIISRAAPTDNK